MEGTHEIRRKANRRLDFLVVLIGFAVNLILDWLFFKPSSMVGLGIKEAVVWGLIFVFVINKTPHE